MFVYNRRGNQAVRLHQRRLRRRLVSGRRFRDSRDLCGSNLCNRLFPVEVQQV